MVEHVCHAMSCSARVRPEYLMCSRHWRLVPSDLQAKVWRRYRRGQCDDKSPSAEWHAAANSAIRWVAMIEIVLPPFYSRGEALRFMRAPQQLLGGKKPVELLASSDGWQELRTMIERVGSGASA